MQERNNMTIPIVQEMVEEKLKMSNYKIVIKIHLDNISSSKVYKFI